MSFLTAPTEYYRESYLAALREFQAEGKNLKPSFDTKLQSVVEFQKRKVTDRRKE